VTSYVEQFWSFWPTSSGPRLKPLDGSISLNFFVETRLKSESIDTLDDLLRFSSSQAMI